MNTNQGHQAQLDVQRIQLLYKHAPYTLIGSGFAACVIAYASFDQLAREIWVLWLVAALAVIPIRVFLIIRFHALQTKKMLSAQRVLNWEKFWLFATVIPALAFASSAFLPYQDNQLVIFLFISLSLVSMVGGSIISSITSIKTVMVFLHLTTIPLITACFMHKEAYFTALGIFFVVFYFMFFNLSLRMNDTVIKAISQQIERKDLAYKDSLTGLWNRRKLFEIVDQLQDKTYSVLLIDIDHFKELNDKHGHQTGDEMLTYISLCILRCTREDDLVVRYGGEEFLIILPGLDVDSATRMADRINAEVAMESGQTVSIGVAYSDLYNDFDALVNAADKAMYRAKREGRNCVRVDNPHLDQFLTTV